MTLGPADGEPPGAADTRSGGVHGERMPRYAIAPVSQLVLNPLSVPPDARRILVIRLGAMGDVVRTLPAVALLRDAYPSARIDWLVEERTEEVVAGRPYVDAAVVFPRAGLMEKLRGLRGGAAFEQLRAFAQQLRAPDYDLVFDFHGIARSGVLARLSRGKLRVGYAPPHAREAAHGFVDRRFRLAARRLSRFDRNEALVRGVIGAAPRATTAALVPLAPAQRAVARALGDGEPPVVLHPGSSAVAVHKRWPSKRFADLARRLADEGCRVVVAAGPTPAEQALAGAVCDASGGGAERGAPTRTFEELAALLAAARAFVGSDSGPLHVASLVGTPAVQLLGPTHPVENEPWPGTPSRRVEAPLACRPCRRGCAAAACMGAIGVDDVVAALRSLRALRPQLHVVPSATR